MKAKLKLVADAIENYIVPKVLKLNLVHFFVMSILLIPINLIFGQLWICVGSALFLGIVKELVDKYIRHEEFKIMDAFSTTLAGIVQAFLFL